MFCLPGDFPSGCTPAVPVLTRWDYGQEETVLLIGIQASQAVSAVREHASALLSENHLSPTLVELLPHVVVFQNDTDTFEGQHRRKVFFHVRVAKCGRGQRR